MEIFEKVIKDLEEMAEHDWKYQYDQAWPQAEILGTELRLMLNGLHLPGDSTMVRNMFHNNLTNGYNRE